MLFKNSKTHDLAREGKSHELLHDIKHRQHYFKIKYVQVVPTKEKRGPVMGWGQLTKVSLVAKPIKKKKQQ